MSYINSNLLHLLTNNIYVVLFYSIYSPSCFSLNKPPSGGLNYKGKTIHTHIDTKVHHSQIYSAIMYKMWEPCQ